MTDGYDNDYPGPQVERLKEMMTKHPMNFIYRSILFNCSEKSKLVLIANALSGEIIEAKNFQALVEAYARCLECVVYKEDLGRGNPSK